MLYLLSQNTKSIVGYTSTISILGKCVANMIVLSFDAATAKTAVDINNGLKRKRKQIDIADLFIASTAIIYQLPFATLNKKHFDRIDELKMVEWANPQKHPTSD